MLDIEDLASLCTNVFFTQYEVTQGLSFFLRPPKSTGGVDYVIPGAPTCSPMYRTGAVSPCPHGLRHKHDHQGWHLPGLALHLPQPRGLLIKGLWAGYDTAC
eukprot:scaffold133495_cov20-Tisochrysis_lutea.AAC.4